MKPLPPRSLRCIILRMSFAEKYPQLASLSNQEKAELYATLGQSMEEQDAQAIRPDLLAELNRRIAEYEKNPSQFTTWEETKRRILQKIS